MVSPSGSYVPDRGHAVWLNVSPQMGHEQAGRRPALVLTRASYNGLVGLAIVCPITSLSKGYAFEVQIPPGLQVSGVVLADHAKNLDWVARRADFICGLPDEVVEEVLDKLINLLTT